jgi:methionyl-tRNA formyltransferase
MRIVYFGDGVWAARCLRKLLEEGHQVSAVIVRHKPSDGSLKEFARREGLPTRAPERVNEDEFVDWVHSLEPELNISMSYDQILRRPILQSASLGFINCHAGKLPYYRGRNVLNWAIINSEKEIGLTIHYVDEGIDTGDIILQRILPIDWEDTYGTLLEKVQASFPGLLAEAVRLIDDGEVDRQPQAHLEGTYFGKRIPGDEWLDWHDSSLNIYNKIRAITHPAPGARTVLDDRTLIIWQAHYDPIWPEYIATPGEVVGVIPGRGVKVKTGDSFLILERVQFEGEDEHIPTFPIGTRLGLNLDQVVRRLQQEVKELRDIVGRSVGVDSDRTR